MAEKEPSSIRQNIGMADTLTSWADHKKLFWESGREKRNRKKTVEIC
jgi:hypothetical protein